MYCNYIPVFELNFFGQMTSHIFGIPLWSRRNYNIKRVHCSVIGAGPKSWNCVLNWNERFINHHLLLKVPKIFTIDKESPGKIQTSNKRTHGIFDRTSFDLSFNRFGVQRIEIALFRSCWRLSSWGRSHRRSLSKNTHFYIIKIKILLKFRIHSLNLRNQELKSK